MRKACAALLLAAGLPSAAADDLDLLAPALALEREISPALDADRISKGLDGLAEGARKRLQDLERPADRLEALLKYLTQERGFGASAPSADLQACDFSRTLASGRGLSENLAIAYAELARRLGIALIPVYAPDRLLLGTADAEGRILVDLAEKAVGLTDAAYRRKLRLPEQGPWLDPLGPAGVEAFLRRRRAGVWLAAGRRAQALAEADRAAALDPARAEHHLALARARWALGDSEGARAALARAREAHPDAPEAALLEGELLAAEGDAEGAAAAFGRAMTGEAPREATLARARLRAAQGRADLSRGDFARALALGGNGGEATLGRETAVLSGNLAGLASRRALPPPAADLRSQVLALLAQGREKDPARREAAQRRLAEMGPRAVPYLHEALKDRQAEARLGALLFLASAPDPGCLEDILGCCGADDAQVRLAALSALGALAEAEALRAGILDRLRPLLERDADGEVRRRAATLLARHRDPAALPYFREGLGDRDPENRRQAALALGRLGDRESAPLLRKALEDGHPRVRARAAQALGVLTDLEAVPGLIQALRDEDRDVRREAAGALVAITRQDFGSDASKWDDWWQAQAPR